MTAQGNATVHRLALRRPWKIAHGISHERSTVIVRIADAVGEAAAVPYLGVSAIEIHDAIARAMASRGNRGDDVAATIQQWLRSSTTVAASCALDIAYHDLLGRQQERPLWDLLGLPAPKAMQTSVSIAMDAPDAMAQEARASHATVLKVKVGGAHDEDAIEAIRGVTTASLRLDANGGWTRERAAYLIPRLARFDVELIEQPLAASDRDGVSWLASQRLGVPMFADESVSTIDDIRSIATDVDGVVVKVRKFGGVAASLEAITLARSLGLRVMIGCMIESSVATTAAAHLGGCCDLVDLDAPLLIANDPYEGVRYEGSTLYLPDRPGIGILPRAEIR